MCCYSIAKTVGIVDFFPKSYKNTRTIETVERLSLFLFVGDGFPVPFLPRTAKSPVFPTKTEAQGIFCFFYDRQINLQRFISVFVDLVGNSPFRSTLRRVFVA